MLEKNPRTSQIGCWRTKCKPFYTSGRDLKGDVDIDCRLPWLGNTAAYWPSSLLVSEGDVKQGPAHSAYLLCLLTTIYDALLAH